METYDLTEQSDRQVEQMLRTSDLRNETNQSSESEPMVTTSDLTYETQHFSQSEDLVTSGFTNETQQNNDGSEDSSPSMDLLKILQDVAVRRLMENKKPKDSQNWIITPDDEKALVLECKHVCSKIYRNQDNIIVEKEVCALLQPRTELQEKNCRATTCLHQEVNVVDPLSLQVENLSKGHTKKDNEYIEISANTNKRQLREVKVLNPMKSGATENFVLSFGRKLEEHGLKIIDTDVGLFNTDVANNEIFIVICFNHSRLLSDVNNALSKIKRAEEHYQRMILVILHIKPQSEISTLSSRETLEDTRHFENIRGIVDVAFSTTNGFYVCPMNTKAIQTIYQLAC